MNTIKERQTMKLKRKFLPIAAAFIAAMMTFSACDSVTQENVETQSGEQGGSTAPDSSTSASNTDWQFSQVAMGGGGFVTGVFSTSEEGLYYARTDVGGAYRWDGERWKSLSYWVSEEDVGMMGIDGLAVDPDEPNKLYLLAGTSYFGNGKTCVLISDDYGDTFEAVDVTELIKASGNGMGRQNGERIAIDPNDDEVLYVGGRTGGLIKSTDGGKTWATLTALSEITNVNTHNDNGICSIVIDPSDSRTVFAAVSKKGEPNLFVSKDAGASWSAVEGVPENLMVQRMRLDGAGNVIITYSGDEGPWNGTGGGIYRLNIASGEVSDISPAAKSYGDVAVDPANPDRMVACTENVWSMQPNGSFGDEFYVTEDGGATWRLVNETMSMTAGDIGWVQDYAIHWCGCLMIDPFNTDRIMVVSGNGIFACDNIWDEAPAFYFFVNGLEETVPMDVVSIPEGPLVSVVLDYDGFVQPDAMTYGDVMTSKLGSVVDLDVAGANSDIWVKVASDDTKIGFYYTEDGGDTWTQATGNPEGNRIAHGGVAAVSADGSRFYWAPDGDAGMYVSTDKGDSWTLSEGIYFPSCIEADQVNSDYVYATTNGSFYMSEDGGLTFTETSTFFGKTRIATPVGKEGVVYITAMGLQKSEDYGKTFTRIESVASCSGVGVGIGETADSTEAIYIYGKPTSDDAIGVYWSADGGATWSPVTDSAHQFGGLGNGNFIVGDNNKFGRCYLSSVGLGVICCDLAS